MAVATTPADMDLLDDARAGDESAFTELYRRHRAAALRVARGYGAGSDAEDLVNTAFERVMLAVRRGRGPLDAFRPYLYVTVRHLAIEQAARAQHERIDDLPERVLAVSGLPALDLSERTLIAQAFSDLPERWQVVLWMVSVEGRQPREVAHVTGLHPNTVSVLAHRARERLRQTYLQAHVCGSSTGSCTPHRSRLGAYVRGGLGRRQRAAAAEHVAGCPHCERLVAELDEVNRLLARAMLPVFAIRAHDGLALTAGSAGTAGAGAVGLSAAGGGGATVGAAGVAAGAASSALAVAGAGAMATATAAVAVAATVGFVALAPHDLGLIAAAAPPGEAAGVVADLPMAAVEHAQPPGFDLLAPPPVRLSAMTAGAGTLSLPGGFEVDDHDHDDEDVDSGGPPGVDKGADVDTGVPPGVDKGADVGTGVPPGVDKGADAGTGVPPGTGAPVGPGVAAAAQAVVGAPVGPGMAAPGAAAQGDAGVSPGLRPEFPVPGTGTVDPLGRGSLAIDVANAPGEAPAAAEMVVESPAATPATEPLATGGVTRSGPFEPVGGVSTSLTGHLGQLALQGHTPVSAGLAAGAPDQTAIIEVPVDGEVLAPAVVPLTPAT